MLTLTSNRIELSYLTVETKLKESINFIKPNVFVLTDNNDRFFCWSDYISKPCFMTLREEFKKRSLELVLENIVIQPSLREFIYINYGGISKFHNDLLNLRLETGKSYEICSDELIGNIDIDKVINESEDFQSLANILYLPL